MRDDQSAQEQYDSDPALRELLTRAARSTTVRRGERPRRVEADLVEHYAVMFPGGQDDPNDADGLATDRGLAALAEARHAAEDAEEAGAGTP